MLSSLTGSARDWVALLPRPAKLAALGFVVLLLALAVFRAVTGGSPDPAPAGADGARAARPGPGGDGATMLRADGDAVLGVLRSTDGAAAAALSYVQQRSALLTGGTTARQAADVGSQIALGGHDVGKDPASIPDRVAATQGDAMLRTRAGQTTWWTVPFGYRVRSYAQDGRAVVRVFTAALSADADPARGPGTLGFSLLDVKLSWREGAWRIRDVDETRDQPTPLFAFGVDSRSASAGLPFKDRAIAAKTQDSVGLFGFLSGADPVLSGPAGMGPVAGRPALDEDRQAMQRDAAVGTTDVARQTGILDGAKGDTWRTSTPLASRRVDCPDGGTDTRCYETLLIGTGTEGGKTATVQLGLAGYVFTGTGTSLGAEKLEIPIERQQTVLGGQLTVVHDVEDGRRTNGAAWRRSVLPLRPVIPAVPR